MTILWDPQNTPNFAEHEMRCKCGCGKSDMDAHFMSRLQRLRNVFDKPMSIVSGYRCPKHNARVSSTGATGPHTTGKAVDIAISGNDAHRLLKLALMEGFNGIGVAQKGPHGSRFLHLDGLSDGEGGSPRPWVWSY